MPRGRKRSEEQLDAPSRHASSKRHRASQHHLSGRRVTAFNEKLCLEWFREYTTADEPDTIGPDGVELFCRDLRVEPENVVMLVLAWKMDAQNMGYFSADEWLRGLSQLQADCLESLRWRIDYLMALLDHPDTFKAVYRFGFDFAREKSQRSMELDTAIAMLRVLLQDRWPLCAAFLRFLAQGRYRVVNRDQWNNILDFSRVVAPDLSGYDENGAWPVMLDEFVDWRRDICSRNAALGVDTGAGMEAD